MGISILSYLQGYQTQLTAKQQRRNNNNNKKKKSLYKPTVGCLAHGLTAGLLLRTCARTDRQMEAFTATLLLQILLTEILKQLEGQH